MVREFVISFRAFLSYNFRSFHRVKCMCFFFCCCQVCVLKYKTKICDLNRGCEQRTMYSTIWDENARHCVFDCEVSCAERSFCCCPNEMYVCE